VQTIIPLSDGSGLRLTTAKYFTPKGRSIHGKGITPDIVVEMPKPAAGEQAPPPQIDEARRGSRISFKAAIPSCSAPSICSGP